MNEIDPRLLAHLRAWLGAWPPKTELDIVTAPGRITPGWDGKVHGVIGVASPEGAVLSVPPAVVDVVAAAGTDRERVGQALAKALGRSRGMIVDAVFRWSERPADLTEAGVWVRYDDPRVPEWLHPFGGDVLVALEGDAVIAGVGIKRHDQHGHELAVVTEPGQEGKGLARRLVAQAARRVIAEGAVPTYLHAHSNVASGHVAAAAGFPDLGWRVLALAAG